MSIIDNTYFVADINLTSGQLGNITPWLNTYEELLLTNLLGYDLYKLYFDDLNGTSNPTEQRFKDLVDGKEFTFESKEGYTINTKWRGLRDSTLKKSLIAYYVYYHYVNQTENFNSGAGHVQSLTENSTAANPIYKLVDTYNKAIDIYGVTPKEYEEAYYLNIDNYEHYSILPNAYNFLLANKDTYPEWVFKPMSRLNYFGL